MGTQVRDVDAELVARRVPCQRCGAPLRPWGFARARQVRSSSGLSSRWWRPRRAACAGCGRTDVLLPSCLLPRRRDDVEVIGAALVAHAGGAGHRKVAVMVDRPASTVRNWLRAFRTNATLMAIAGARLHAYLDAEAAAPIKPSGSTVIDAVEALAQAARAVALRLGPDGGPWPLINMMTAGRLLAPGF